MLYNGPGTSVFIYRATTGIKEYKKLYFAGNLATQFIIKVEEMAGLQKNAKESIIF